MIVLQLECPISCQSHKLHESARHSQKLPIEVHHILVIVHQLTKILLHLLRPCTLSLGLLGSQLGWH